jgi:UDP-N-acetylmuramoyl-tripeptide--D-alanyl-D-alanine ligase
VRFSALRGERVALPGAITLVDDCYNANPMSMRAAIDDLAETAPARRVAVLGDMLELGHEAGPSLHREVGAYAAARGVEVLVTVGPLAAAIGETFPGETHSVPDAEAAAELLGVLLREGDTVLVKGSRGVGLERVAQALQPRAHASPPISAPPADRLARHPSGRR